MLKSRTSPGIPFEELLDKLDVEPPSFTGTEAACFIAGCSVFVTGDPSAGLLPSDWGLSRPQRARSTFSLSIYMAGFWS